MQIKKRKSTAVLREGRFGQENKTRVPCPSQCIYVGGGGGQWGGERKVR